MVSGINALPEGWLTMEKQTAARPSLQNFLLGGLRIAASTVAIVELLRNDWVRGGLAAVAWIVFSQVERLHRRSDEGHHNGSD